MAELDRRRPCARILCSEGPALSGSGQSSQPPSPSQTIAHWKQTLTRLCRANATCLLKDA